jgi:signal transduction histidine kinase
MGLMMAGPVSRRLRSPVNFAGGSLSVLFLLLVMTVGSKAEIVDRVPRVLILYPYDERIPGTNTAGESARKYLIDKTSGKIDLFSEFLDLSRFPEKPHVARMARFLAEKYTHHRPDVVIALGAEAIGFIVANRAAISPDAKIVYCGISASDAAALNLPDGVVGALTQFDIAKTLDMAIRLQPSARKLVVIGGSSEFDHSWIATARNDLAELTKNLETTYLVDLSIDEFAERVSGLSPDNILLVLTVFSDRTGRNFIPREALQRIATAAGAPTYGPYSTYIGYGIVGGNTVTFESMGTSVAELAIKALAGEPIADVAVPQSFVADARQIMHWGLQESALPLGSVVSFKEKTLWEEYWAEIIAILSFAAVQSLVIAALLFERRRRAAAEQAARGRLLEVVHLNQSATAGALSASIAHELNQPLGAIRNNAEAAGVILRSDRPDLDLVRQILVDIRDDDQRAGDIIQRLRGLLKKRSEIDWQEFDINDVVTSALQILHGEAERRSVLVNYVQTAHQLPVRADRIHVQQVILNIATNAMDAMLDATPARRMLLLQTDLSEGSKAAVSISDAGKGIPSDQLGRVFETFYTTKSHGTGLGLSIARAIVETYGGKIWADNRPEGGAVVSFVLPLVQP